MSKLRGTWERITGLFHRDRRDAELSAELESHLQFNIEDNLRAGMSPEEARRQALLKLGGLDQVKESYRDQRGLPWLDSLLQDTRFALRILRKNPAFTITAVLTLALGIGATTAIFTVVYGTLLRTLPFPDPSRLVQLGEIYQGRTDGMSLTAPQLQRLRDFGQPFEAIAGYTDVDVNVKAGNGAEHVRAMPVSSDFLRVLAENPEAGRNFSPQEDSGAGEPVALLSHALSIRRFGGAAAALGQTVFLSGQPYTVIGVMPVQFSVALGTLDGGPPWDVWIPLARVAKTAGSGENIGVLARIKSGATQAEISSATALARTDFHKEFPGDAGASDTMGFIPLAKLVGTDIRSYLLVLFGATGFVLLIACANVSNLLLARGSARTREIAVRLAMGASRGRLIRQLLTESMLLAVVGGVLGLVIAREGISALVALGPNNTAMGSLGLPRINDIRVDGFVLAFALLLSFIAGAIFGIFPAFYAGKTNLTLELKEGSTVSGVGKGHSRLRQGLVAAEFALSLVLLTGAGLMIATCANLLSTNPGFDPHHVLTMEFWLGGSTRNTTPQISQYYDQIEQKIAALPGVQAVGVVAAGLPLERGGNLPVHIAGPSQSKFLQSNYREASPGYFQAMGMTLLKGRGILDSDTGDSAHIAVVNHSFESRYFPGHSAIGEHVIVSGVVSEIVGVVADAKSSLEAPTPPATFIPAAQASYGTSSLFEGWFPRRIVIRTAGDPLALSQSVRNAVASVDSSVPTGTILSMDQMMSRSVSLRQFMMFLLSLFGGLALILASVGIYGVISYTVSQRTREIGIRMALGARPAGVLAMVLAEGLKLVVIGAIFGITAAVFLTRLLRGMLYGVTARDPLIFALGAGSLILVSLAACLIPARRAMRVDPVNALRCE